MTALLRQPAQAQPDMFPDARELGYAMNLLTQRYIWYYPTLNQLTGGHKSGLMLGLLLHWSRHYATQSRDERNERDGWMWKTGQEWRSETGLTRHEQDSARAQLIRLNLIEEQKRGMPARMFFRVRMDQLGIQLSKLCGIKEFSSWDWNNTQQVLRLLGRPVAFYLRIAQLSGGATNSLYLSYLLYAQRQAITTAYTVNWIRPRPEHVEKVLGMSYKVQLLARKQLTGMGLIQCRSRGFAQSPEIRLLFARVAELLGHKPDQEAPVCRKGNSAQAEPLIHNDKDTLRTGLSTNISTDKQVQELVIHNEPSIFTFPANSNLPFRQTENAQTGKLIIPFSANTVIPNQQTSLPEREITSFTNTSYLLPQHSNGQGGYQAEPESLQTENEKNRGGSGGGDLDFGDGQSTKMWRAQALEALIRVDPYQRQVVLDEWIARLESTDMQPVRMPLRFLDKLIANARSGEFRPEMGHTIAQARKSRSQLRKLHDGIYSPVVAKNKTAKQVATAPAGPSAEIKAQIEAMKQGWKTNPTKQAVIFTKTANSELQSVDSPRLQAGQAGANEAMKLAQSVDSPRLQAGQAGANLWKFLRSGVGAVANTGAGTGL